MVEVRSATCDGCGAPLPAPEGLTTLVCTYCRRELRVVGRSTSVMEASAARSLTDALLRGYTGEDVGEARRLGVADLPTAAWQAVDRTLWPVGASASSSFGSPSGSWSPTVLRGPPRVFPRHGDIPGAWAPRSRDSEVEWIELEYAAPHLPVERVRVFETNLPGAAFAVTAVAEDGAEELLWQRRPKLEASSARVLEVTLPRPRAIARARIYVNNSLGSSWSEIDTVGLVAAAPLPASRRTAPWSAPRGSGGRALVLAFAGLAAVAAFAALVMLAGDGGGGDAPDDAPVTEEVAGTSLMVWSTSRPGLAEAGVVWASAVVSRSSEYQEVANGARQVLGLPDVFPLSGDNAAAWAPGTQDGGLERITVRFPLAVRASSVAIVETYGAGALAEVDDVSAGRPAARLWRGTTGPAAGARVLSVELPTPRTIDAVRVVLDTRRVPGWNEIDAIGLVPARPAG